MFFYTNPLKWVQKQKIYHTDDNSDGDRPGFGQPGLAVTEDNSILAVAAYRDESNTGATFIFKNVDGMFQQTQKLTGSGDGGTDGDRFGSNVRISSDGNILAIGSDSSDEVGFVEGSVYIFNNFNDTYIETQKLTASDSIAEGAGNIFGWATSISPDGNTLVVSSRYDTGASPDDGVVRIFQSSSSGYQYVQKLTSSISRRFNTFGHDVAITEAREKIIVLQRGENTNKESAVFIFDSGSTGYKETQSIIIPYGSGILGPRALSINKDASVIAVGDDYTVNFSGSVYIIESGSSGYALTQTLTQSSDGDPTNDRFGYSVVLNKEGNTLFVSAYGDEENGGTNAGAVYLFENSGDGFKEVRKILADDPVSPEGDRFGYELELSGDHLYVAASYDDVSGSTSGAQGSVYAFKYTRDY